MSAVEDLLATRMRRFQDHLRTVWAGREREGVIDFVRAADEAACILKLTPDRSITRPFIVKGATPALAALLPGIRAEGPALPYSRSTPESAAMIDHMLHDLGKLVAVQRLAALERYGLASCRLVDSGSVEIDIRSDEAEEADREAGVWLSNEIMRRYRRRARPSINKKHIVKLLDRTSSVDRDWPIRYDGHKKLIRHYRDVAMTEVRGCFESEALPDQARIGGKPFSEWREACAISFGSLLNHIDYSFSLHSKHPEIMLRDMLTTPVLRHDAVEVWLERGQSAEQVAPLIKQMTFDAHSTSTWLKHYEIPSPYYVDVGGGWLLLCAFGTLFNPIHGLVRSLRITYGKDWDAVVDDREERYRDGLPEFFPASRFSIPKGKFILKRNDGSHLTDIDAMILDRRSGNVALIQLKWLDIVGLSPSERDSKRRNLLGANEWVERVDGWIAGRNAGEIASALGVDFRPSVGKPLLFVMPRYAARYTANTGFDARAAWVCWPEVARFMNNHSDDDAPLAELAELFKAGGEIRPAEQTPDSEYEISDLRVRVRCG